VLPGMAGMPSSRPIRSAGYAFGPQAPNNTAASQGWVGYSLRTVFAATTLANQDHVRFRLLMAARLGALSIGAAYVGLKAASGNAWDFAAPPKQLFSGGAASWTIANGNFAFVTDWVQFTIPVGAAVVVSFYFNNASNDDLSGGLDTSPNINTYYKNANEPAIVAPTGWVSATGKLYSLTYGLEVGD